MDLTPPVVHDASVAKVVKKCDGEICDSGDTGSDFRSGRFRQLYGTRSECFVFIGTGCPREWHHPAFLVDDGHYRCHSVFCR